MPVVANFSEYQPAVANCFLSLRMTGNFADSGRPSGKQTLINKGFS